MHMLALAAFPLGMLAFLGWFVMTLVKPSRAF